jgi:hypothetical protein
LLQRIAAISSRFSWQPEGRKFPKKIVQVERLVKILATKSATTLDLSESPVYQNQGESR